MKLLSILAAAAILAAPTSLLAQGKPGAGSTAPEAEMDPGDAEMLEMLRTAVAEARDEMYAPGPRVDGWDRGGGDPDSQVRTAGADSHWLLQTGDEGSSVVMLTRRPIADFAPRGWRIADSYGSADAPVANPFVQFVALTPRYMIASRANTRRVATADCSDPVTHAILYEVPGAPDSPEDEDMPFLFRIFLLASEDQVVCTRYETEGSVWRPRAFLPDGRSLPQLDEPSERVRVVPAAPLETLLQPPGRGTRA
ncbi:MAG TPA: hypothetical protein VF702_12305 [Allosphingosinicella sp.]|jgi:hypothetical protein